MALIGLAVAVRKRHLVGTIQKSSRIYGNNRESGFGGSFEGDVDRWGVRREDIGSARLTHRIGGFAEHAQELCILVEDTDVGSPPRSNSSKPAGLSPDDRYSSLARLRAVYTWGIPKVRALREATYFIGMRKAGMPEE